jgi:hypothetical protein
MRSRTEVETFVQTWVAAHVHGMPIPASLPHEVDRLAARLTGDARAEGISGGQLAQAFGDLDDYLTGQYEQTSEPASGTTGV